MCRIDLIMLAALLSNLIRLVIDTSGLLSNYLVEYLLITAILCFSSCVLYTFVLYIMCYHASLLQRNSGVEFDFKFGQLPK